MVLIKYITIWLTLQITLIYLYIIASYPDSLALVVNEERNHNPEIEKLKRPLL